MQPGLSEEDQERVARYLSLPQHQVERRSFKLWHLLGVIWGVLMLMSGVSYWIARSHGVI